MWALIGRLGRQRSRVGLKRAGMEETGTRIFNSKGGLKREGSGSHSGLQAAIMTPGVIVAEIEMLFTY